MTCTCPGGHGHTCPPSWVDEDEWATDGDSAARIIIPASRWPGELLNINAMRVHHQRAGSLVRPWRQLGKILAREQHLKTFNRPVELWARFRFPTNQRRDTGNLYPTIKALIDGFVDAKVLVDDCDGVLFGPFLVREYPNGPAQITIEMTVKL